MLWVLLGAAFCLLVSSCANVASLELAQVVRRARTFGVQLALGASRGSLVRVVMLEGLFIVGCALLVGLGIAWTLMELVRELLPNAIRLASQNPIALDTRAIWYAAGVAGVTWLLVALAPVVSLWRGTISRVLTFGGRVAESRRGTRIRGGLTVVQVGLAVALVVVGLLYARSYRNLLAVDKGFDSSGLGVLSASLPNGYFGSSASRAAFVDRLLGTLRGEPGVVAATEGTAPPDMGDSPTSTTLIIDGQPTVGQIYLGRNWIDPAYFAVTRLPLRAGRYLEAGDLPSHAVITEAFARRFWPEVHPIGRTFSSSVRESFTVVGVVDGFRTEARHLPSSTDDRMFFYVLRNRAQGVPQPQPVQPPPVDTGGSYGILNVMVRLERPERLAAIREVVQALDPRLQVTARLVDDEYADQAADVRLTSTVVGLFSGLAFVIAMAGLYAVIAFLVASRTREIGVRMALGADRVVIRRMVLASSGRLALTGAALGTLAAVGAARWIESQLFGVSMTDPSTYLWVCATVFSTALLATWYPARQAARVDPAVTLRAE
jgi:predicted permease